MKRNKFSKALKHLKSKKIDEKLKLLDETPTNNMSGVYQVTPDTGDGFRMGIGDPAKKFYPKADGTWPAGIPADASDRVYVRSAGYWEKGKGVVPEVQNNTPRDLSLTYMNANGNDTSTMIRASDGMVYADLPEGTRSFILGPLITSYTQNHIGFGLDDDFTNLGYIQKDTRQFVLLGRIEGFLDGTKKANGIARTWDGTATQFTSYNSNFKLEHALWMQQRYKEGNFTDNVPFNLSGGIPADRHPDDASKASGSVPGSNAGQSGGDNDNQGTPQDPPDGNPGFPPESMGYPWGSDPNDPPPTRPKRSDFPPGRNGQGAFNRAKRKYKKDHADWKSRQGKQPDPQKPDFSTGLPDGKQTPDYQQNRNRQNKQRQDQRQNQQQDPKPTQKSDIPISQRFEFDTGTSGQGMPSNPDFRGAGNNKNTSSINTTKAGGSLSKYTSQQQDQIRKLRAKGDLKGEIKYVSQIQLAAKSDAYQKGELSALGQVEYRAHQLFHNINNILSPVTDFTDKFNEIVGPVVGLKGAPTTIIGKIAKPIISTTLGKTSQLATTLFQPADNGLSYNLQHATALVSSIVSGQPVEVKVSGKLKNEAISNLNAEKISKILRLGPATKIGAEKTIRPDNKGDIFNDGNMMGIIGGYEFSVDGDKFTFSGQKMLRTDEQNPVTKNEKGKIVRFKDIPEIEDKDLSPVVDKIITEPGLVNNLILKGAKFGDKITGQSDSEYNVYNQIKNDPEALTELVDELTEKVNAMKIGSKASNAIQGTASNSVALRKILTKLGFPKSQAEKEGKGFGQVYTTITGNINELPIEVQNVIKSKQNSKSGIKESFTSSQKKILREVTQPLKEIKELPKTTKLKGYRPNFKGKFSPQNTPDVTASKVSDDIVSAKNSSRQIWTAKDKYWKGYETTERMNIIYDNLGHGSQYFDRIVGENVRLKNKKSREVQEHLNMLAHQRALREVYGIKEYEDMIDESETYDNKINDPLFTKVAKRLKKEIDYPKKPAAKGYPNKPPAKIDPNTGMHPKFGKRYKYDKLDPQSAEGMPMQGDPEIDANIQKATDSKRKARKIKNLLGK